MTVESRFVRTNGATMQAIAPAMITCITAVRRVRGGRRFIQLAPSVMSANANTAHIAAAETLRNAPMPPYFKGESRFDYFERTGLPFVVGINTFDGQLGYNLDEVRWALAVRDDVPVLAFDARFRGSVRDALLVVLDQALDRAIKMKSH